MDNYILNNNGEFYVNQLHSQVNAEEVNPQVLQNNIESYGVPMDVDLSTDDPMSVDSNLSISSAPTTDIHNVSFMEVDPHNVNNEQENSHNLHRHEQIGRDEVPQILFSNTLVVNGGYSTAATYEEQVSAQGSEGAQSSITLSPSSEADYERSTIVSEEAETVSVISDSGVEGISDTSSVSEEDISDSEYSETDDRSATSEDSSKITTNREVRGLFSSGSSEAQSYSDTQSNRDKYRPITKSDSSSIGSVSEKRQM